MSLNQDVFNEEQTTKKRSVDYETNENLNYDWSRSSSLQTLKHFKRDHSSLVNEAPSYGIEKVVSILKKTTKQACNDMFMNDSALVACSASNIFNINQSISLCELDYDASPVKKRRNKSQSVGEF